MRLPTPKQPDQRGRHRGRPYWIWLPDTPPPWPGMVIVHGAGSAKENHADFGRLCASSGWAAVSYDQRGHGESEDEMTPEALADVSRIVALLAQVEGVDQRRICVRGSSMGGFMAIEAAASSTALAGVIAICPADAELLRRRLREGRLEMRADIPALDAWLGEHDLTEAAAELNGKPLILLHARGDDRVPHTSSERIYESAGEPRRLIVVPGGSHHSVQHDPELQAVALRWLERQLGLGA